MKKILLWAASLIILLTSGISPVKAIEPDMRAAKMRVVLARYNSPMLGLEEDLIRIAEENQLDWTMLAAIAGTESSFGKRMPHKCINPYGWGIYGDNKLCFTTFLEAAEAVAHGLSTRYNTSSLESIARTYNTVSTDGWLSHTRFFINKIKNAEVPVHSLPITL